MNAKIIASALFIGATLSAYGYAMTIADHTHSTDMTKAAGHSGGTDQYGCHTNSRTGEYHCHNPK